MMERIEKFKKYLEQLNYSASAVRQYVQVAGELEAFSKGNPLTSVVVESYYGYQLNRQSRYGRALSKAYLNSQINGIKAYLKYLRLLEGIRLDMDLKRYESKDNEQIAILSQAQIQTLYTSLRNHSPKPLKLLALLAVLYGCGLRKSEAAGLNIEDVDFGKDLLYVQKGKGSASRYVPMNGQVKEDLWNYIIYERKRQYGQDRALFISREGKRQDSFYHHLRHMEELSGLQGLRTHLFRHSIATHLMQQGMELRQISKFLGHRSLESTQIYTHLAYGTHWI